MVEVNNSKILGGNEDSQVFKRGFTSFKVHNGANFGRNSTVEPIGK